MADRRAERDRTTSETQVSIRLALDGGEVKVDTGVPFFDHMLDQLGTHGRMALDVRARGDLDVDAHHTVEDVGIVLGDCLNAALGERRGIRRYGHSLVPMDEALAQVALDVSGRGLLVYEVDIQAPLIGTFDASLAREFLQGLARAAGLTLHVRLLAGDDPHHCVEAIFKALGRALSDAISLDASARNEIPSTKGRLTR
jgi:imidazoleglycerol-phosphate dehydratase